MDEHTRIGQREALRLLAGREQHRGHRRGLAEADGLDIGLDVLHRVVDGQSGRDRAAGRVDVDGDVLLGILGLEEQQLRDDQVRDVVVDGLAEEDDVVFEQTGVDVVGALAARRLLYDHRDQDHSFSLRLAA